MGKYSGIEKVMCKELETYSQRFNGGVEMSLSDLEKIDMIAHALKSLAAYEAMKVEDEDEEEEVSGRRGRSPRTGRYVSRDSSAASYAEGYSQGYSAAMSQHGGPYPPEVYRNGGGYSEPRKW